MGYALGMERATRFLLVLGTVLLAIGAASSIVKLGADAQGITPVPYQAFATSVLLALLSMAGVAAARQPRPVVQLGLGPGQLGGVALGVAVLGAIAVSYGLDGLLRQLELRNVGSLATFDRAVSHARQAPQLLGVVVALALAPAFAEELLFRGFIQRALTPRVGAGFAIGVAALLFGAVHGDVIHAAAAFLLGLYLGVVAHLAGSTRAPIICHAANNLGAIAIGALGLQSLPDSRAWTAISFALAGLALLILRRSVKPDRRLADHPEALE